MISEVPFFLQIVSIDIYYITLCKFGILLIDCLWRINTKFAVKYALIIYAFSFFFFYSVQGMRVQVLKLEDAYNGHKGLIPITWYSNNFMKYLLCFVTYMLIYRYTILHLILSFL